MDPMSNFGDQSASRHEVDRDSVHFGSSVMLVCAALPSVWLATFFLLVVRARLEIGSWPHATRGNPISGPWDPSPIDPKSFALHYEALVLGAGVAFLGLVVAGALLLASLLWRDLRPSATLVAIALAANLLVVAWGLTDPGGYFLWFAD